MTSAISFVFFVALFGTSSAFTDVGVPSIENAWDTGYTVVFESNECSSANGAANINFTGGQTNTVQQCIDECNKMATCTHIDIMFDNAQERDPNKVTGCFANNIPEAAISSSEGYTCLKKPE